MKKVDWKFLSYLIIFTMLGFLGGIVGELWLNSFLLPDPYLNFKSYDDLAKRLDNLLADQGARRDLNERDLLLESAIKNARAATVNIYQYKNLSKVQPQSLLPTDFLAVGSVLTGDGWLISEAAPFEQNGRYLVLAADGRIYETETVVIDEASGAAFLKINAVNLSVMELVFKNDLAEAQSVYYFDQFGNVSESQIANLSFAQADSLTEMWRHSEVFYKYIKLNNDLAETAAGGPVITSKGKLLGFVSAETGLVVPIDYCKNLIKNLGKTEFIKPVLGINFYDLAEYRNPAQPMVKGAWLASTQSLGIASPAKGILQVNDVILKIESEEISALKSLPEIIAGYPSGATLNFTIWRAGQEKIVAIKLK